MREAGLRKRAVLWLLLLAPFFFASYGFATWYATQQARVASLVFGWEGWIPFWAWTIVPYWSIDLLYGFSLLLPLTRRELDCHALRLLTAQVVAVSCFLLWPLRFTFERPELDGLFGWLFAVLAGFDKPFNQAPSLHIALLVILWVCYARHVQGAWRWLLHGWFGLIGVSVLTTYQHHFVDLPTGALLGWLCVWLWPDNLRSPLAGLRVSADSKRRRLSAAYMAVALLAGLVAFAGQGGWLWLLWPSAALLLVGLNYAFLGAAGFQKQADGRHSMAARWLFAPYRLAAWANSRAWTYRHPQPGLVTEGVWLGRIPTAAQLRGSSFKALLDMCAELPAKPAGMAYQALPALDLCTLDAVQCRQAAQAIEALRKHGPLLVCCALGYSRSATAVAAWLLLSGRATSPQQAMAIIRQARPRVVFREAQMQVLGALSNPLEQVAHGQ
jgi:protein-tyrosine phosphatase/membrane-associated phospholipid phosphatase